MIFETASLVYLAAQLVMCSYGAGLTPFFVLPGQL